MLKRKTALEIVRRYGDAWINKDPEAIVSLFTNNGRYHEYVLKKPYLGHSGIRKYWERNVVKNQFNIKFRLLKLYIAEQTAIAECDASFYEKRRRINIHMKLLLILEIKGNKISYLREYWSSEHDALRS
jgi:hypothetical protein